MRSRGGREKQRPSGTSFWPVQTLPDLETCRSGKYQVRSAPSQNPERVQATVLRYLSRGLKCDEFQLLVGRNGAGERSPIKATNVPDDLQRVGDEAAKRIREPGLLMYLDPLASSHVLSIAVTGTPHSQIPRNVSRSRFGDRTPPPAKGETPVPCSDTLSDWRTAAALISAPHFLLLSRDAIAPHAITGADSKYFRCVGRNLAGPHPRESRLPRVCRSH